MRQTLGVWQRSLRDVREIARASRVAMSRAITRDVALEIGWARNEGVLIGAMQRACDGPPSSIRRGTPGCAVRVGPGTLHVIVITSHLDHPEDRIVNRQVRPLLHAMTAAGCGPARHFGRDWIDVAHHPIAHIGFAHDRKTGRTVFEAFIAVRTRMDVGERASYLGKTPTTLEDANGKRVDDDKLVRAVIKAYGDDFESESETESAAETEAEAELVTETVGWAARIPEAIGDVCAGKDSAGVVRIGGEWMASFDAVRECEERVARGEDIRAAVDAAFTAPHTAIFGVRSLESIARAIEAAMH